MKVEVDMRQKGFATILSLCLILVIALIVKGIQESETNHAREVLNFETEQALQSAAESGIFEAAEKIRIADKKFEETSDETSEYYLPYKKTEAEGIKTVKKNLPVSDKKFYHDEQEINIEVEVWGERGEIYFCPEDKNYVYEGESKVGVYLMSRATIEEGFFGEKIYRRAYAYFLDEDNTKINFMELPTKDGDYVKKYDKKPTN